ncbi:hypothetical protein D3C78_1451180 [compost metagenome]
MARWLTIFVLAVRRLPMHRLLQQQRGPERMLSFRSSRLATIRRSEKPFDCQAVKCSGLRLHERCCVMPVSFCWMSQLQDWMHTMNARLPRDLLQSLRDVCQ